MGPKTLRIYLCLYLFLLDFFTYLPFTDDSYNLWPDQMCPISEQRIEINGRCVEGWEKQQQ